MMNRVLHLFIPPQKYVLEGFSAGIQSIASYMKVKHPDLSVRIHDLSHKAKEEVTGYLRTTEITGSQYLHFAGISTTTATYQAALDLSRKIKRINKKTIVIMGGHHVNSQEDVILGLHTEVDIIVRGEGELPLAQLIENYPNLKEVQGITYRVSGQPKNNPAPPLLTGAELDALPFDINEVRLQSPLGKFDHITYVSARGCPLKCHFCAVSNERIRSKSINKVIEDLKYLVLKKGYKKIAIEDNFFAQSPKRTIDLCNAIVKGHQQNSDFRFTWDCQTRVESVLKREIVSAMKKAGCEAVYLGIENFDSRLLKYLGKTGDPIVYLENTRKAVGLLTVEGIDCYINLQIGLPGEGREEKQRNLDGMKALGEIAHKNKKTITVFPMLAVVYPGTYLFKELVKNGVSASVFEDYTLWEEQHEEMQHFLSDHFAHGTGGLPTGLFDNIEQIKNLDFDKALLKAFRIVRYIDDLKKIPHVSVFDYSSFIVTPSK
jgi:anaerobic magnesium-protoporphyrin IX monomethyl ester cyclase